MRPAIDNGARRTATSGQIFSSGTYVRRGRPSSLLADESYDLQLFPCILPRQMLLFNELVGCRLTIAVADSSLYHQCRMLIVEIVKQDYGRPSLPRDVGGRIMSRGVEGRCG